ncbi:MAG: arginine decarboxylase, pyruvoyl-dependent [Candidatus Hydrothermarchaeota archaeon]|nr:MAG: arginine decarboxylase, pyruvoyl-dependent [Candidatus Hydrothermarchaeota archaeon]
MIPKKVFFTSGVGKHEDKLVSFELALRDAGIEKCNLVKVSSVLPPNCEFVDREEGLKELKSGEIVFVVMSEISSKEEGEKIIASLACAYPKDRKHRGYIAEYCCKNKREEEARKKAEEIATLMLTSLINLKEVGKISISNSTIVEKGKWSTVIAAAVFIL